MPAIRKSRPSTARALSVGLLGLLAVLALTHSSALRAQALTTGASDVLVVGRISDDPRRHYEQMRALLDYVVPRLAGAGIREGRVLMARDAQQMASYLRRGRVDWVTETAGMGLYLAERAGARVIAVTERDGVAEYRGVIFARRDSGITSISELAGRSIAFQRPNSTSAYFAPAADLLAGGLRLEMLLSPTDRPDAASVGYVFALSEQNIATWVHKRLVDAGAFSDVDWNNLHRLPQAFRNDLVVIHQTAPFPRALEVVRGDIDPRVEAALRQVLLQAGEDPEAREPLLRFFGTNRFRAVDAEVEASLATLRAGVLRVRAELE